MTSDTISTRRLPKAAYTGTNGFTEFVEPRTDVGKRHALADNHRWAQSILKNRGHYFPTMKEMRELDEKGSSGDHRTLASATDKLKELREEHSRELERMYDNHAMDYEREALDRYFSRDETQYLARAENNPVLVTSYAKLDSLYRQTHPPPEWFEHHAALRHAHLTQELPLQAQIAQLNRSERAMFPSSIREYHAIKNKDVQFRIARFLAMDTVSKERMMTEFGWNWKTVRNLEEEYVQNNDFKMEIQEKVKEDEVRDPRKKS